MSFLPYTADMPTGYFVQDDIYMTYTEYYGDGTVYGLRHVHNPDGTPGYGLGPGLTRADLVARGMLVAEERAPAVPIDVSVVPEEGVCAAAAPAPAPVEEATPAPAPEVAPPAEEPKVEKTPTKVIVKLGGVSVVLNKVLEKDIVVNIDETAGVVEFVF
jgi:hypothetical protein